jgi:hypothetical protein
MGVWPYYLQGAPQTRPRTASAPAKFLSADGGCFTVPVPLHDAGPWTAFCQQHAVDAATIVQTAWALLLRYYLRSDEVIFSYTTCELPSVLPRRVRIDESGSVAQLLHEVQAGLGRGLHHGAGQWSDVKAGSQRVDGFLFNTLVTIDQPMPSGEDVVDRNGSFLADETPAERLQAEAPSVCEPLPGMRTQGSCSRIDIDSVLTYSVALR